MDFDKPSGTGLSSLGGETRTGWGLGFEDSRFATFTGTTSEAKTSMRISRNMAWKLFLVSSVGLAVFTMSFHRKGWDIFLERPHHARSLPLAIMLVIGVGVWVFTLAALLLGKRVPKHTEEPEHPVSSNDDRWLE